MTKRICGPPSGRDAEDGTTKGTLALLVALAAVVLFAPIARADVYDATHPYRNAVNPTPDGTAIGTADGHGDHDGKNDHDCDAHDEGNESGHDDGEAEDAAHMGVEALGAHASDDGDHDDDGCDNGGSNDTGSPPGDTTSPPQNPSTSGLLGGTGYWVWVLLVAVAAIAVGTGVVLRRRMTRNR